MSIKLRVRYQLRYFSNYIFSFKLPSVLTGAFAKVTISTLVIFFGIGYISQIGSLTTSGYEIAALEKQLNSLGRETQKLSSELAVHQSINSVQKRLDELRMQPVKKIKYIKADEKSVAQR